MMRAEMVPVGGQPVKSSNNAGGQGGRITGAGKADDVEHTALPTLVKLIIAIPLVIVSGLQMSPYWLSLSCQAGTYAVAVLGLMLIMGMGGQPSLGHVAFFGVGAYASAKGTVSWELNPYLAALTGIVMSIVLAVLIGWPALRLKGPHLAVATFTLGSAFFAFVSVSPLFEGQLGIGAIPSLELFGWTIDSWTDRHLLVWSTALLIVLIVSRLSRHRFGRSLAVMAFDEEIAESLGIKVRSLKITAFAASAAIGALAGSLFAHTNRYVSPNSFNFQSTILMLAILFVGGTRSPWAALVSAAALVAAPQLFNDHQELQPTFFALLLLVVLLVRGSAASPAARWPRAITQPAGERLVR